MNFEICLKLYIQPFFSRREGLCSVLTLPLHKLTDLELSQHFLAQRAPLHMSYLLSYLTARPLYLTIQLPSHCNLQINSNLRPCNCLPFYFTVLTHYIIWWLKNKISNSTILRTTTLQQQLYKQRFPPVPVPRDPNIGLLAQNWPDSGLPRFWRLRLRATFKVR